jgi:uncharacterized protein
MNAGEEERTYTAFAGVRLLASGDLKTVLLACWEHASGDADPVLIFEDQTGRQVDFDLRGTPDEVVARALPPKPRTGPGRPKLGVVCREVSLLPRHWDWLEQQPSGASAALRRLVDEARKREPDKERARLARDAAAKVMWAMAGDCSGFEEASRALFAGDQERFESLISEWPQDVRAHLVRLTHVAPQPNEGDASTAR